MRTRVLPIPAVCDGLEIHQPTAGSRREADGNQVARSQLHAHRLHTFPHKHEQRIFKDGRMPGIEADEFGRDPQSAGGIIAKRRELGHLSGIADLPEGAEGPLPGEVSRRRQVSEDQGLRLRRVEGEIELFLGLRQGSQPFGVDTNRDPRQGPALVRAQCREARRQRLLVRDQTGQRHTAQRAGRGTGHIASCRASGRRSRRKRGEETKGSDSVGKRQGLQGRRDRRIGIDIRAAFRQHDWRGRIGRRERFRRIRVVRGPRRALWGIAGRRG